VSRSIADEDVRWIVSVERCWTAGGGVECVGTVFQRGGDGEWSRHRVYRSTSESYMRRLRDRLGARGGAAFVDANDLARWVFIGNVH
jgi:hypothetical protein